MSIYISINVWGTTQSSVIQSIKQTQQRKSKKNNRMHICISLNSSDLLEHLAMLRLQHSQQLVKKPLKQGYQYHKRRKTFFKILSPIR